MIKVFTYGYYLYLRVKHACGATSMVRDSLLFRNDVVTS